MRGTAWRTVIIEPHDSISLRDNCMLVTSGEGTNSVPVSQIREIMVNASKGSISLPLLAELAKQNTSVTLCDKRNNPVCEMNPVNSHFESAGRIMDQVGWTGRRKQGIWRKIVKMKIARQMDAISLTGLEIPDVMVKYLDEVLTGDCTNREAMAAKVYFKALYGNDFERFGTDAVNSALNYGYTIICSAFNRAILMQGYSTCLGIHHCNRQNPYNLSCDLMEPFRPFVDKIVKENEDRELDWNYKQELISILHHECIYDGKKMEISNAIEEFSRSVVNAMNMPRQQIGEVQFVK